MVGVYFRCRIGMSAMLYVRFRPKADRLEAGQFVQTTLDTWQFSALLLPVRRLVPVELHRLNRIFMGDSMILEKNLQLAL